jgi:hypothetical protein
MRDQAYLVDQLSLQVTQRAQSCKEPCFSWILDSLHAMDCERSYGISSCVRCLRGRDAVPVVESSAILLRELEVGFRFRPGVDSCAEYLVQRPANFLREF